MQAKPSSTECTPRQKEEEGEKKQSQQNIFINKIVAISSGQEY
jgi:hypothetical protein